MFYKIEVKSPDESRDFFIALISTQKKYAGRKREGLFPLVTWITSY
jgi:hypothetical protein